MTAHEIRKLLEENLTGRVDGTLDDDGLRNALLGEIAAQLAEMNERAEDHRAREQLSIHSTAIRRLAVAGADLLLVLETYLADSHKLTRESAAKCAIANWKEARG